MTPADGSCAADAELTFKDIQALDSADAVAAFFARLGYNTTVRIKQEPANLGITADSALKPIDQVELIANREDLLQVYLFKVKSVTVSHTRALARAVGRNRIEKFLLVLTSDYERIDFVLLETNPGPGQKLTVIRPRALTVPRRHPDRVQLRVLRRFTNTESDAFAQYDKLLSAFTIADWSEEYFNNRALFSDYYLTQRLTATDAWREDSKPTCRRFCDLYRGAAGRWAGKPEADARAGLIEPALKLLGLDARKGKLATDAASEPDYRLYAAGEGDKPLAVCLAYTWGRSLDGKDYTRDKDTPDENPGAVVVSVLKKGEAPWAVVTNGKTWRLYSARTHSRATNYYEVDLEEVLATGGPAAGDPAEAFKYFWLLYRREAFEEIAAVREGEERRQPFLDNLLDECHQYAKELGERLKERVFDHVFVHFSRGFLEDMRARRRSDKPVSQEELDAVYRGTLTFLYRMLFLLYGEARDLLPVREKRGYWHESIENLKQEIAQAGGTVADDSKDGAEARLKKHYSTSKRELYDRFTRLCAMVDKGDPANNVPVYNGGLFITEPDPDDESEEAESARFLAEHRIPDFHLARGLDWLARDLDPKRNDLVPVDYKSLGVRQLGSIYEGLLEFRLRIAPQKMAVVEGKRTEEVVPYSDVKKGGLKILKDGRGKSATERTYARGELYLENDKRERKATGSYYTPDHIVKYIVENAVGPVLDEKLERLTPEFRKAERDYREAVTRKEEFARAGKDVPAEEQVDSKYVPLLKEFCALRVLDPAMGSGHFLVEAVDFVTDRMIDFLNGFPRNPVYRHVQKTREEILSSMEDQGITIDRARLTDVNLLKRHVLKGCIYGVDLNPMAVELAKVSLWLDCFTLGAPLSFLDHHLRCGNSLIGVTVEEVRKALGGYQETGGLQFSLLGDQFAGLMMATDLMRHVGELSDVTTSQVRESRAEYQKASDALAPFKRILDFYASQWFGNAPTKQKGKAKREVLSPVVEFMKSPEAGSVLSAKDARALDKVVKKLPETDRKIAETALTAARERRFFHWELEFPEVFYGPRPGTERTVERLEGAGFDAVIGNPPYDVLAEKELGRDVSEELAFFHAASVFEPAMRGKTNLYKTFISRSIDVMGPEGRHSFIVPMALLGDDQSSGVRKHLLEKTGLAAVEAFPQKDDPKRRVFPEAKLSTCVFVTCGGSPGARFAVRTHPGRFIEGKSSSLHVTPDEIARFDPANVAIPSCTQRDWDIASGVVRWVDMKRLGDYCQLHQGEINETVERPRRTLSDSRVGPKVLRGAAVTLYAVREASQGDVLYLHEKKFLGGKGESSKAFHHRVRRVGVQRKAPQNNFRRLIAAPIPEGSYCFESISYCIEGESALDLDLLAALLNTELLEWYFRMSSSNAQVNEYQFNVLPAPTVQSNSTATDWKAFLRKGCWDELARALSRICSVPGVMPGDVAEAVASMSRRIQEIEAKRKLKSRSERSHLAPESQPIQDAIDRVLFRCYGVSDDDAEYIKRRLKEML